MVLFHLQILTPEKILFEDEVLSLIVPGEEGYLGILAGHAPLITSLKAGALVIKDKSGKMVYFRVDSGFVEVNHNNVSLVVEKIESSDPVNIGTEGVV